MNREEKAFVFPSGLIEFAATCPKGALPLISAEHRRPFKRAELDGLCRVGYRNEYLVPGMPEAANQVDSYKAMTAFIKIVDSRI